jgi:acyl carrier protein
MEFEDTLRDVMSAVFAVPTEVITPDSSMDTIEGWDSLKHMNLVIALEDEFGVSIPDEDAADITSYALVNVVLEDLMKA